MRARRFNTAEALTTAVADLLEAQLAQERPTPQAVMLSGGKTPFPAYAMLASRHPRVAAATHILFSDERHVPDAAPDSNYGNTRETLNKLGITEAHVLRVRTELALEAAAEQYDRDLAAFLARGGVTLGLLGLGADGHTASLFSLDDIERGRGRLAIPVVKAAKPDRISVTADFLSRIERVVFLVSGADKAPVVDRLLKQPLDIPAGRAVAGCRSVELWIAG